MESKNMMQSFFKKIERMLNKGVGSMKDKTVNPFRSMIKYESIQVSQL